MSDPVKNDHGGEEHEDESGGPEDNDQLEATTVQDPRTQDQQQEDRVIGGTTQEGHQDEEDDDDVDDDQVEDPEDPVDQQPGTETATAAINSPRVTRLLMLQELIGSMHNLARSSALLYNDLRQEAIGLMGRQAAATAPGSEPPTPEEANRLTVDTRRIVLMLRNLARIFNPTIVRLPVTSAKVRTCGLDLAHGFMMSFIFGTGTTTGHDGQPVVWSGQRHPTPA